MTARRPPSARWPGADARTQFAELIVHGDAESLKDPRRRVQPTLTRHGASHEVGEALCRIYRLVGTGLCNPSRRPAGEPFLAIFAEYPQELLLAGAGQPFRRGRPGRRVHPHVQRAVPRKGEPPGRIVQLQARNADIEEDPVNGLDAEILQHLRHVREPPMVEIHATRCRGKGWLGPGQGLLVPVESDNPA